MHHMAFLLATAMSFLSKKDYYIHLNKLFVIRSSSNGLKRVSVKPINRRISQCTFTKRILLTLSNLLRHNLHYIHL